MSQLYARIFLQILDSSIAEDFTTRHVFEDFLKLSEDGVVDMTRQSLSRRLNIPIETLNQSISKLENSDPNSRDVEFQGRRIERLDEHRDWGWRILNWEKYEKIRTRADVNIRVSRHRLKVQVNTVQAEAIYQAYPRKVAKNEALKAITKALEKEKYEHLLERTEAYAKARNGDLSYMPNPSTWFNQERYNDDPKTWVRTEAPPPQKQRVNLGTVNSL